MVPTNEPTDDNVAGCGKTTKDMEKVHTLIAKAGNIKESIRTT